MARMRSALLLLAATATLLLAGCAPAQGATLRGTILSKALTDDGFRLSDWRGAAEVSEGQLDALADSLVAQFRAFVDAVLESLDFGGFGAAGSPLDDDYAQQLAAQLTQNVLDNLAQFPFDGDDALADLVGDSFLRELRGNGDIDMGNFAQNLARQVQRRVRLAALGSDGPLGGDFQAYVLAAIQDKLAGTAAGAELGPAFSNVVAGLISEQLLNRFPGGDPFDAATFRAQLTLQIIMSLSWSSSSTSISAAISERLFSHVLDVLADSFGLESDDLLAALRLQAIAPVQQELETLQDGLRQDLLDRAAISLADDLARIGLSSAEWVVPGGYVDGIAGQLAALALGGELGDVTSPAAAIKGKVLAAVGSSLSGARGFGFQASGVVQLRIMQAIADGVGLDMTQLIDLLKADTLVGIGAPADALRDSLLAEALSRVSGSVLGGGAVPEPDVALVSALVDRLVGLLSSDLQGDLPSLDSVAIERVKDIKLSLLQSLVDAMNLASAASGNDPGNVTNGSFPGFPGFGGGNVTNNTNFLLGAIGNTGGNVTFVGGGNVTFDGSGPLFGIPGTLVPVGGDATLTLSPGGAITVAVQPAELSVEERMRLAVVAAVADALRLDPVDVQQVVGLSLPPVDEQWRQLAEDLKNKVEGEALRQLAAGLNLDPASVLSDGLLNRDIVDDILQRVTRVFFVDPATQGVDGDLVAALRLRALSAFDNVSESLGVSTPTSGDGLRLYFVSLVADSLGISPGQVLSTLIARPDELPDVASSLREEITSKVMENVAAALSSALGVQNGIDELVPSDFANQLVERYVDVANALQVYGAAQANVPAMDPSNSVSSGIDIQTGAGELVINVDGAGSAVGNVKANVNGLGEVVGTAFGSYKGISGEEMVAGYTFGDLRINGAGASASASASGVNYASGSVGSVSGFPHYFGGFASTETDTLSGYARAIIGDASMVP